MCHVEVAQSYLCVHLELVVFTFLIDYVDGTICISEFACLLVWLCFGGFKEFVGFGACVEKINVCPFV